MTIFNVSAAKAMHLAFHGYQPRYPDVNPAQLLAVALIVTGQALRLSQSAALIHWRRFTPELTPAGRAVHRDVNYNDPDIDREKINRQVIPWVVNNMPHGYQPACYGLVDLWLLALCHTSYLYGWYQQPDPRFVSAIYAATGLQFPTAKSALLTPPRNRRALG